MKVKLGIPPTVIITIIVVIIVLRQAPGADLPLGLGGWLACFLASRSLADSGRARR